MAHSSSTHTHIHTHIHTYIHTYIHTDQRNNISQPSTKLSFFVAQICNFNNSESSPKNAQEHGSYQVVAVLYWQLSPHCHWSTATKLRRSTITHRVRIAVLPMTATGPRVWVEVAREPNHQTLKPQEKVPRPRCSLLLLMIMLLMTMMMMMVVVMMWQMTWLRTQ